MATNRSAFRKRLKKAGDPWAHLRPSALRDYDRKTTTPWERDMRRNTARQAHEKVYHGNYNYGAHSHGNNPKGWAATHGEHPVNEPEGWRANKAVRKHYEGEPHSHMGRLGHGPKEQPRPGEKRDASFGGTEPFKKPRKTSNAIIMGEGGTPQAGKPRQGVWGGGARKLTAATTYGPSTPHDFPHGGDPITRRTERHIHKPHGTKTKPYAHTHAPGRVHRGERLEKGPSRFGHSQSQGRGMGPENQYHPDHPVEHGHSVHDMSIPNRGDVSRHSHAGGGKEHHHQYTTSPQYHPPTKKAYSRMRTPIGPRKQGKGYSRLRTPIGPRKQGKGYSRLRSPSTPKVVTESGEFRKRWEAKHDEQSQYHGHLKGPQAGQAHGRGGKAGPDFRGHPSYGSGYSERERMGLTINPVGQRRKQKKAVPQVPLARQIHEHEHPHDEPVGRFSGGYHSHKHDHPASLDVTGMHEGMGHRHSHQGRKLTPGRAMQNAVSPHNAPFNNDPVSKPHTLRIARQNAKMPSAMRGVMGAGDLHEHRGQGTHSHPDAWDANDKMSHTHKALRKFSSDPIVAVKKAVRLATKEVGDYAEHYHAPTRLPDDPDRRHAHLGGSSAHSHDRMWGGQRTGESAYRGTVASRQAAAKKAVRPAPELPDFHIQQKAYQPDEGCPGCARGGKGLHRGSNTGPREASTPSWERAGAAEREKAEGKHPGKQTTGTR